MAVDGVVVGVFVAAGVGNVLGVATSDEVVIDSAEEPVFVALGLGPVGPLLGLFVSAVALHLGLDWAAGVVVVFAELGDSGDGFSAGPQRDALPVLRVDSSTEVRVLQERIGAETHRHARRRFLDRERVVVVVVV